MKPKFCPSCGKTTEKLFNGLCKDCQKKKEVLAEIPEKIKITVCKNCEKIEGTRSKKLDENGIIKIVRENLKENGRIKELKTKIKEDKKRIKVDLIIEGKLKSNVEKQEILETVIEKRERLCDNCGKIRGGYYEGVIQIRSDDLKKSEKISRSCVDMIKNGGHVTKITRKKNGFDIYMTPKKIMNRIINDIKDKKEVKRSYTLVTKKDGKDLYRNTILVRV